MRRRLPPVVWGFSTTIVAALLLFIQSWAPCSVHAQAIDYIPVSSKVIKKVVLVGTSGDPRVYPAGTTTFQFEVEIDPSARGRLTGLEFVGMDIKETMTTGGNSTRYAIVGGSPVLSGISGSFSRADKAPWKEGAYTFVVSVSNESPILVPFSVGGGSSPQQTPPATPAATQPSQQATPPAVNVPAASPAASPAAPPAASTAQTGAAVPTITFVANDLGATGSMSTQTVASGSKINLNANAFSKKGWRFGGWATTLAGENAYGDGAIFTMGRADVTLYAKWIAPSTYAIGDRGPSGGWIFYVSANAARDGFTYLEAAASDQTPRAWGTKYIEINGAKGTAIGSGRQNTADIISGDSATDKAADECASYSVENGGIKYDDWFLPSTDELKLMYTNLTLKGMGGFGNGLYWSSSQTSTLGGVQDFTLGYSSFRSGGYMKSAVFSVRAVRTF